MKTIIKILILLTLVTYLLMSRIAIASAPAPVFIKPLTPQELVAKFALQYNVSAQKMLATMNCESSFNTNAIGDFGTSFGLSQIHLPAHPEVTKEQALQPDFAVEFMAKGFAQGKAHMWSCYRKLY